MNEDYVIKKDVVVSDKVPDVFKNFYRNLNIHFNRSISIYKNIVTQELALFHCFDEV